MTTTTKASTSDFDSPWKAALEVYFEAFMAFCFPDAHADIDWSAGYEFLDHELQKIVRDAETGRRHADKLVKVHLKDGRETWLLIHIEVQGYPDGTFEERMYIYNYRIFDRYRVDVVSLAVLTDDSASRTSTEYRRERWGCELIFRFPTADIMNFEADWDRLENDPNPFAIVVMAHIKARSVEEGAERKRWKLHLVRLLLDRGYDKTDILELFRFIDWLLTLPEDLEIGFRDDVIDMMEEKKMPYVTSIERLARKEGARTALKKNVKKAVQKRTQHVYHDTIMETIKTRFRTMPEDLITGVSFVENPNNLKALFQYALPCEKLDDFRQMLLDMKTGSSGERES
jgi:hypothetical protein